MITSESAEASVGWFRVHAVNGRTKTETEWAEEIADKLIFVSDHAPAPIREQARAFRQQMVAIVAANIRVAVLHEREACAQLADSGGAADVATAIRARVY